jgi:hypothetical protein
MEGYASRVIDGVLYDTYTADVVCDLAEDYRNDTDPLDCYYDKVATRLFQHPNGRFFVGGAGGPNSVLGHCPDGTGLVVLTDDQAVAIRRGCHEIVAGIPLTRMGEPDGPNGGHMFRNLYSGEPFEIMDNKVAAACEYVMGALVTGCVRMTPEIKREWDRLRDYIKIADREAYRALID